MNHVLVLYIIFRLLFAQEAPGPSENEMWLEKVVEWIVRK